MSQVMNQDLCWAKTKPNNILNICEKIKYFVDILVPVLLNRFVSHVFV